MMYFSQIYNSFCLNNSKHKLLILIFNSKNNIQLLLLYSSVRNCIFCAEISNFHLVCIKEQVARIEEQIQIDTNSLLSILMNTNFYEYINNTFDFILEKSNL